MAAIEATFVEEHPLPEAVATLVVLRVNAVWFSSQPYRAAASTCCVSTDETT